MIQNLNLFQIFNQLDEPKNQKEINFNSVPDFDGVYVGKKIGNFPVIFFKSEIFKFTQMPNEKFNNIKISRGINNNISILDKQICGPFFSFELISNNSLMKSFFRLIEDLILFFKENPDNFKIKGYIEDIENLFVDTVEILDDEVVGLFGELLLIHSSSNVNRIIDFWHLPLNARFDFSSGYEKIEVKTTSNSVREHYISLEQIQSDDDMDVLICSILVSRVHHGEGNCKSINDLISEISSQLSSENLVKFNEVISEICKGLNVSYKFRDYKFDYDFSLNSMVFFDTQFLPKLDVSSLPDGVSQVKFKETLDEKYKLNLSDLDMIDNELFNVVRLK